MVMNMDRDLEWNGMFEHNERVKQRKALICELLADDIYVPMKETELAVFMQVPGEEREEFRRILQSLVSEGRIQVTGQGKYVNPQDKRL